VANAALATSGRKGLGKIHVHVPVLIYANIRINPFKNIAHQVLEELKNNVNKCKFVKKYAHFCMNPFETCIPFSSDCKKLNNLKLIKIAYFL